MNLSCSEKVVAEVELYFLWRRHDSNVRTTLRFDLQSNAFGHFATPPWKTSDTLLKSLILGCSSTPIGAAWGGSPVGGHRSLLLLCE